MNLGDMLIESAKEAADLARARYGYDFDLGFQQIATALNSPLFEEIAQLRAALAERQWQPIETAPRDTKILLGGTVVASEAAKRNGSRDIWCTEIGRYLWGGDDDPKFSGFLNMRPTYWAPLPEPPKE